MFMYVSMIRLLDGSSKAHLLHAIQSQMYYDKFSFVDVNYTKYTVTNVHNTNFSIIHTLNIWMVQWTNTCIVFCHEEYVH